MIGWLRGRLLRRRLPLVVVDVGGVGYELLVPLGTFGTLPPEGSEVELEVLTVLRQESLQLYGFASAEEKRVFEILLGVSGVGPKLALAVLSTLEPPELVDAVRADRPSALERVPGIGRKTARRLVLELKDRLPDEALGVAAGAAPAPDATTGGPQADAVAALVNLGYRRPEAEQAVRAAMTDDGPPPALAELIRASLQRLGDRR
ncbi:MAG: Holliday junction branch migration protein RuvA [Acidobacteriota bacterium]